MTTNKPMTVASRGVTLRDFAIFQVKLFLDGMKDFLAIWLSIGAIILDFIAGRGKRPRLFYSVGPRPFLPLAERQDVVDLPVGIAVVLVDEEAETLVVLPRSGGSRGPLTRPRGGVFPHFFHGPCPTVWRLSLPTSRPITPP